MEKKVVFIYSKDDEIKVLSLEESLEENDNLILDGWKHTVTLDAMVFIKYLLSFDNDDDIIGYIRLFMAEAKAKKV